MTAIDEAFIRAYTHDKATAASDDAARPVSTPVGSYTVDAAHTTIPAPHTSVPAPETLIPAPAPASQQNAAADAASEHSVKQSRAATSGAVSATLTPSFEVERFEWPAICESLFARARKPLDLLAGRLGRQAAGVGAMTLVAGCRRGDGATTLTLCLGRALAAAGARVVLVDADFRHPQLAARLGFAPVVGWNDVLASKAPLEDALVESVGDRLTVLPLREAVFDDRQASENPRVSAVTEALRLNFDVVLVDSQPLRSVNTPVFLAALAGGGKCERAVLVHDARLTSPEMLAGASRSLHEAGCTAWDLVENFVVESAVCTESIGA